MDMILRFKQLAKRPKELLHYIFLAVIVFYSQFVFNALRLHRICGANSNYVLFAWIVFYLIVGDQFLHEWLRI